MAHTPMRLEHLPDISPRFWIALSLASVLGANLGDLFAHDFGLGHLSGLPYLAAIFAVTMLTERFIRGPTEAFYWVAIVTLRTAATNLADLGSHDWKLDDLLLAGLLGVVLAAATAVSTRDGRAFFASSKPRADGLYWFTMLTAGTFGTALGDGSAGALTLGGSTLLWLVVWAAALTATLRLRPTSAAGYWGMVCVVRTVGTNLGDWLAGRGGLHLGLPLSATLSAILFAGALALWPSRTRVRTA